MNTDARCYPIGQWTKPLALDKNKIATQIQIISGFPDKLKRKVISFSAQQLGKAYRPGGWTAIQVINHCADSHMNAFIRFKLALTEDKPTIKPYAEAKWAELPDAKSFPVDSSVQLIEALHARWAALLLSLDDVQWNAGFIHPEHGSELKLYQTVSLYSWHCEHHYGHLDLIR